ncbi:MAG: hypothetical protein ACKV19_06605 [Verrucomicrobiales bacterium]
MNTAEPNRQSPAPDPRRVKVSGTDWLVIWSTLFLTIALDRLAFPGWWLPGMVVAHFFVFCNIVKVPRKLEILWALLFVINSGLWFAVENFDWRPVLFTQTPFTLATIGMTLAGRRRTASRPHRREIS